MRTFLVLSTLALLLPLASAAPAPVSAECTLAPEDLGCSAAGGGVEASTKAKEFTNGTIKVSAVLADVDGDGGSEGDGSLDCEVTGPDATSAPHLDCEGQTKAKEFSNGTIKVSA